MESDFAKTLNAIIFFFILGSSESKAPKVHLAKDIVDFLLKQRVDGEKALILDLKKQSKVCNTCVLDGTREARVVQWDAGSYIQDQISFSQFSNDLLYQ